MTHCAKTKCEDFHLGMFHIIHFWFISGKHGVVLIFLLWSPRAVEAAQQHWEVRCHDGSGEEVQRCALLERDLGTAVHGVSIHRSIDSDFMRQRKDSLEITKKITDNDLRNGISMNL